MEEISTILLIASLIAFGVWFFVPKYKRVLDIFVLTLSVCGLSAIFQDTTLADNLVYLIAFPLIAVSLFAVGDLCVIKKED